MSKQDTTTEKLTMANTKKEMLEAYNRAVKQLTEKREREMKPAEKIAEKKHGEATAAADSLSTEGVAKEIGVLKSEIGKMLNQLADRLEEETKRYLKVKKAVEVAETELQEVYGIEKSASSLAALLEAQRQKREEFETETAVEREQLAHQINSQRAEWEQEVAQREAVVKERDAAEEKQRQREKEEYEYQFQREKQLAREQFEHEKASLEREVQFKKEEMLRDLDQREQAVAEAENELKQLREKVQAFPQQLQTAVNEAANETAERLTREADTRMELLQKEFEGERNVLNSRIEGLQQTVQEQSQQIARLSQQLTNSYGQVQDIAVKAIEGSSNLKSLSQLQAMAAADPPRRPTAAEK